jgi:four helix bundle protein
VSILGRQSQGRMDRQRGIEEKGCKEKVKSVSIEKFEDVVAWQKAKEMSIQVYRSFESTRDYGFRDQVRRASVSVMNNIAEGFERQTNKEFRQFLFIAKGSCAEVRSMLYLATELKLIEKTNLLEIYRLNVETSRILAGLIKSLKT